eukprot:147033-Rhodomonas_salina.1
MAMALTENIFVAAAAKPSLQSSSWRDGRAGGEGRVGARMQRCMPATNLPFQSFAISAVFLFRPQPKRGFSIICQPVRREHARDAGNSGDAGPGLLSAPLCLLSPSIVLSLFPLSFPPQAWTGGLHVMVMTEPSTLLHTAQEAEGCHGAIEVEGGALHGEVAGRQGQADIVGRREEVDDSIGEKVEGTRGLSGVLRSWGHTRMPTNKDLSHLKQPLTAGSIRPLTYCVDLIQGSSSRKQDLVLLVMSGISRADLISSSSWNRRHYLAPVSTTP